MLHESRVSDDFVVYELQAGGDGEPISDQQLWDALTRTFQSAGYQPPMLPAVASELLAVAKTRDADISGLLGMFDRDPQLSARVLALCSTKLYGDGTPIGSLEHAVVRLGLVKLRDAVIEASLGSGIFKSASYSEAVDRVRVHSVAVAHFARCITRFTSFEAPHAFLCGLLHDVGLSAALVALGDVPRGQKLRPVVDLWPALSALHATVGGSVATLWQLPPEVRMVLRLHHTMKVGDVVHPVAAIVVLAEAIACEHSLGLVPPSIKVLGAEQPSLIFGPHRIDVPPPQLVYAAKAALGFDDELFARVDAACREVLGAL